MNGKPTVMGGYEKGATPRDQDRVTFGIKGSESEMGQGIALDPLMPYHDCMTAALLALRVPRVS